MGRSEQSGHSLSIDCSSPPAELRSYEFLPSLGWNLVQKHLGTRFVKRALGRKHFLHERRLRPGKHVTHFPLLLNLISNCVLDRASVEFRNLLKFIQADSHAKAPIFRQLPRQGENIRGDRGGIETSPFAN